MSRPTGRGSAGRNGPGARRTVRSWRILLLTLGVGTLPASCDDAGGVAPPQENPPPIPCTFGISLCRERVPVGGGFRLPVYRTHPLDSVYATITRAVVVVHGTNRNADDYFETMVEAARQAGVLGETLVLAPRFQTSDDLPPPEEPVWTSRGWKRGNPSVTVSPGGTRLSSYAALDRVLDVLADASRFPELQTIVVTGHSAGGQYTHRFGAGSPSEEEATHLLFRYVVANPSTYLYLGPERFLPGTGWGLPDRESCPDYDGWHYGLENLNSYMDRLAPHQIRDRLVGRDVVYLVGVEDTGTHLLDRSCGAMLQGPNRYHRGLRLYGFMNRFFPGHRHDLHEIAGVGHSSRGVYTSETGRAALFSW